MNPTEIYDEFVKAFKRQKLTAGLLIAFIDFLSELGVPSPDTRGFEAFIRKFPKQELKRGRGKANTLIVMRETGNTLSLRPFYDKAEAYFHAEKKRFDYPNCAPYATGIWEKYKHWLDAITTLNATEIASLRQQVVDFVLFTLKDQSFVAPKTPGEPPLFRLLLEKFDLGVQVGEPTGAAFQGIVFGFLRADNPHLQVEIAKVRTGSKRLQRVADIDGWDGARLAISAEVKQSRLGQKSVDGLKSFANEVSKRGAIGLVVALGFDDSRGEIDQLGVRTLDPKDLLQIVSLWDPLKQRTAVASFVYYARHVEKCSVLADRLEAFLARAAKTSGRRRTAATK